MSKLKPGINDLETCFPDLAKEWNSDKNGDLKPSAVTHGAGRKVWWKCPKCGHEWENYVRNRVQGSGCPLCSNRVVVKGKNDIATKFPDLMKEWDFKKNSTLDPSTIAPGSSLKTWWKCRICGKSWAASINSRTKTRATGCPSCGKRKVVKGKNDLATTHPNLVKEWFFEKNGNLKPEHVTHQSTMKVWWRCHKCGYEWKTSVFIKTRGAKCPFCIKRVIVTGKNDLATINPELMKEWNFEKNSDVDPTKIGRGYNKPVWWKCKICGKEWKTAVCYRMSNKGGCPSCNIGKYRNIPRKSSNTLAAKNPELLKEWDFEKNEGFDPSRISRRSNEIVYWKCPQGHSYTRMIKDRTNGYGCYYCSGRKVMQGLNDLASAYPDLLKEWDSEKNGALKPTDVHKGSSKKAWWRCKHGHSWQASVSNRARGSGCPICSNRKKGGPKKVVAGVNDLATTHPEIAEEWDFEKNGDLKPTSVTFGCGKEAWWKCKKCGNEWCCSISARTRSHNTRKCAVCAGFKRTKSVKCLETGEVFPSQKEASEKYNITPGGISKCCRGKANSSGGHRWEYVDE